MLQRRLPRLTTGFDWSSRRASGLVLARTDNSIKAQARNIWIEARLTDGVSGCRARDPKQRIDVVVVTGWAKRR
jgi:hypothetical protein